jgi:hypothetical protein
MAASLKDRPMAKIVLAVLGAFVVLALAQLAFESFRDGPASAEAEFDAAVLQDPNMGATFKAMQRYFPGEYAALRTELIAQRRAGASQDSVGATGFARMAEFRKAHIGDLAKAPSVDLQAYRQSQAALLASLARDSQGMCARYTFASLQRSDRLSPASQKALAEFGTIQFRAIAAGQKRPVARATDAPQPQDLAALTAQMKAGGLSDRHLAFFLGESATPIGETEQCQTGLAMTQALLKLPVDQADRLSAVLVSHS